MTVETSFGEVIARRELLVEGSDSKVIVELAKPVSDGQDFGCAISYDGEANARTIFGVDAFQALQLALNSLAVDLKYSGGLPLGRMHWRESGAGTGFPEPKGDTE